MKKKDAGIPPVSWQVLVIAGVLALFGLFLYLSTVSSYVDFGDSGESVACAVISGVAHPPGYPLYTVISKIFTYLPLGTVVFRVNMVSVIASILVLFLLTLTAFRVIPTLFGAALSALMILVSPAFWDYATYAKCYALGLLIIILMIYISLGFPRDKNPARVTAVAFLLGLGLANHYQTVMLFFPAVLYFLASATLKNTKKLFSMFMGSFVLFALFTLSQGNKPLQVLFAVMLGAFYLYYLVIALKETPVKYVPLHILFFLVGLLPYLYIPWAAGRDPLISWDSADTFSGFLDLISIRDYRTAFNPSIAAAAGQFKLYFILLFKQFGPLGLALAAIGAARLFRQKRTIAEFFTVFWVFQVGGFALQLKTPMDELTPLVMTGFYLPSHLAVAVMIASGAGLLYDIIRNTGGTKAVKIAACVLPFLLFAVPVYGAVQDFRVHDKSRFYFVDDYAENVFMTLPENAVLFSQADDGTFPLWYKQSVEKARPDAAVIFSDLLSRPWYRAQVEKRYGLKDPIPGRTEPDTGRAMLEIIAAGRDRVFYIDHFNRISYGKNIPVIQEGILYRVATPGEKPGFNVEKTSVLLPEYKLRGVFDPSAYKDFYVKNMMLVYTKAFNDLGKYLVESGKKQEGMEYMEKALRTDPGNKFIEHNLDVIRSGKYGGENSISAGIAYRKGMEALDAGDINGALKAWDEAIRLDPQNPGFHNDLANLLSRIGRTEEAEKHYKTAISSNPGMPYVHYNLGRLYEKTGRADEAAAEYNEELKVNPGSVQAGDALKRLKP